MVGIKEEEEEGIGSEHDRSVGRGVILQRGIFFLTLGNRPLLSGRGWEAKWPKPREEEEEKNKEKEGEKVALR